MNKAKASVALTLVAGMVLLLTGCRENPNGTALESIVSATDNAAVESEFSNIFEFVDDEGSSNKALGKTVRSEELRPDCAVVSVDTVTRTMTMDFGDENCLCKDGLYRRGRIIAQFTGKYHEAGSSVSVSLENYFVQDQRVEGSKTLTRTSDSSWTVQVTGAELTTKEGVTLAWSSERMVTRVSGQGTPSPWDDVYSYTGSAVGVNRNGVEYTATIDEPLVRKIQIGCMRNFVDGVLSVTDGNGRTMTLDYDPVGGAPCDKTAEVTINGETRTITLR